MQSDAPIILLDPTIFFLIMGSSVGIFSLTKFLTPMMAQRLCRCCGPPQPAHGRVFKVQVQVQVQVLTQSTRSSATRTAAARPSRPGSCTVAIRSSRSAPCRWVEGEGWREQRTVSRCRRM